MWWLSRHFLELIRYYIHFVAGWSFLNENFFRKFRLQSSNSLVLAVGGLDPTYLVAPPPGSFKLETDREPLLTETGNGSVKCTYCGKDFTAIRNARRHVREIHMGQTTISCHLCPRTFGRKERLKVHLRSDHSSEYFE